MLHWHHHSCLCWNLRLSNWLSCASKFHRLALKAFTDQKRRFFPHLDDEQDDQGTDSVSKKHRNLQALAEDNQDNLSDCKTLSNVLTSLEKDMPNLKILTYERLDWLKRASSLPASANDNTMETPKHNFHSSSILRPAPQNVVAMDKVAVIELLFPSVFRAVASLHPPPIQIQWLSFLRMR